MTVTAVQRGTWKDFHTRALERVAAIPGVSHVAFAWGLPLTGNKWPAQIEIPGAGGSSRLTDRVDLPLRAITPDYFAVMGMALAEGRNFHASDDEKAPRVAVDQCGAAAALFRWRESTRTHDAVCRRHHRPAARDRRHRLRHQDRGLSEQAEPEIYLSLWQSTAFSKHMVVRTTGDPLSLATRVRRRAPCAWIRPSAVEHVTTMAEIRRQSIAARTFAMRLLSAFAVVATLLAVVGLYGVLSLSVGSRTKEIAVRKAVGAQEHQIVRLVLGEVARLVLAGLAAGTIAALAVGRLLGTLLFEVRAADPDGTRRRLGALRAGCAGRLLPPASAGPDAWT